LGVQKIRRLKIDSALGAVGAICVMAFALVVPLISWSKGITHQPWGMIIYCAVVIGAAFFVMWANRESPERKVTGLLIAVPAYLIIITELMFLIDRMNTIFKGWNGGVDSQWYLVDDLVVLRWRSALASRIEAFEIGV